MVRLLLGACPVSFCGYYSTFARFFQAREPDLLRARDRAFFPAPSFPITRLCVPYRLMISARCRPFGALPRIPAGRRSPRPLPAGFAPCTSARRTLYGSRVFNVSNGVSGSNEEDFLKEDREIPVKKNTDFRLSGAFAGFLHFIDAALAKKAKKRSCNNPTISATLFEAAKSHKLLVINVVYSGLRTRVLTAVFALLILRPPKSLLKSKGLALFCRHRHHLTENFSTPKAEFVTEDGGNSRKSDPGLSVFAGICRIFPFYRRRASTPLRPFAARSGASLPA